jgi:hypothetical protein
VPENASGEIEERHKCLWLSFSSKNAGKVPWLQPAPAVPPKEWVIQPLDIQSLHPQPQRFQQLPVKKRQRRLGLMQSQIYR